MRATGSSVRSTRRMRGMFHGAVALALALGGAGLVALGGPAAPALAVPGNPGVPAPPQPVYEENFENGPAVSPILRLNQYTGATGQTYTADPYWLANCNGWVASGSQDSNAAAQLADCPTPGAWVGVQQLAAGLGVFQGLSGSAALANHAVSAYTDGPGTPPAGGIELATAADIPLPTSSRFLSFRVDVAAVSCFSAHPLLQFSLVAPSGQATPVGSRIDGCSSPTTVMAPAISTSPPRAVQVGRYTTDAAVLFTGPSFGVRMVNDTLTGAGNDHAFDNIEVLDTTPQLDKQFVGGWGRTGGTARLQFTVTNTSELGAKNGWVFQDDLPAGVTVASPSNASSTCASASVTATGARVAAGGSLAAGMSSCTVDVDVTAAVPGVYVNGPDRLTLVGLDAPAPASVLFANPAISLQKTAGTPVDVNQDGLVDAGDLIPYTFQLTDTGDVTLTGVGVDDPVIGAVSCPATTLTPGASTTCTASYTITQANQNAGVVVNSATAHGDPPAPAPQAVSAASNTRTPVTAPAPGLSLVKSADPTDLVDGQDVTYSFALHNTGNLVLNDVAVQETAFTGAGTPPVVHCPQTTLAVSAQEVCTADYTVTAADILSGTVDNTAVAVATPAGIGAQPISSAPSSVDLPSPAAPGLVATITSSGGPVTHAGDEISYSVHVENTGNIRVHAITIDPVGLAPGRNQASFACADTTLVPGQGTDCTATYVVTQADIDSGSVVATVQASGELGDGTPVASPAVSTTTAVTATAALSLTKTAAEPSVASAGQTIGYSFAVTNTGSLTVDALDIADTPAAPAGPVTPPDCPVTTLAPGDTVICTADYTTTQADVDHGSLSDTAVASAMTLAGATVESAPSALSLPVVLTPVPPAPPAAPEAPSATTTESSLAATGTDATGGVLGAVAAVAAGLVLLRHVRRRSVAMRGE